MPDRRRNSIVKLCVASLALYETTVSVSALTIHRKTTRSRRLNNNKLRSLGTANQEENTSEHNIVIPQMMYGNERDLEAIFENFLW